MWPEGDEALPADAQDLITRLLRQCPLERLGTGTHGSPLSGDLAPRFSSSLHGFESKACPATLGVLREGLLLGVPPRKAAQGSCLSFFKPFAVCGGETVLFGMGAGASQVLTRVSLPGRRCT